jgi:putative transposase
MNLQRCYRFRLAPTPKQEQGLRQFAGCRRFVWNWALERKQAVYQATGQSLSYGELAAELVQLKQQPQTAFLRECDSQALQQTLRDLERAFLSFFAGRARFPKRKSRKRTPHAFRIPQRVRVEGPRVRIPKIGLVKLRLHRQMEGTIKSATIKQSADGRWHVTFVSHFEQEAAEPSADRPAGLDVGLESFATFDDGRKIAPPKFYRKQERKLKRLHRHLSRCRKGSRNRTKACQRLAVGYAKVRSQRHDWLHQRSREIVSGHDTVCIEDLNLKGLVRTKLGKSFSDAAHGAFARMLLYKGAWYGCRIVQVGRFFASSKTCSACGHHQHLELSDRRWVCAHCGAEHDRDINAARNLLGEGLRILAQGHGESLNACGEDVSLATSSTPRGTKKPPGLSRGCVTGVIEAQAPCSVSARHRRVPADAVAAVEPRDPDEGQAESAE